MVRKMFGDLLTAPANILCHQTNYYGVMGAGVAATIRNKLLSEAEFQRYRQFCAEYGSNALGKVFYSKVVPGRQYVANCFCQREFDEEVPGVLTDYDAMRECLTSVRSFAESAKLTVALPGYMGCGIAGGDWNTVMDIINDVFSESSVSLTIVFLDHQK